MRVFSLSGVRLVGLLGAFGMKAGSRQLELGSRVDSYCTTCSIRA